MKSITNKINPIRGEIVKVPKNMELSKTITVMLKKRILDSKYKRYYTKNYKRLVHYVGTESLKVGQMISFYNCRRISAHKSAICYGTQL